MTTIWMSKPDDGEAVLLLDGVPVDPDALVTTSARELAEVLYYAVVTGSEDGVQAGIASGFREGQENGARVGFDVGYAMNGGPVPNKRIIQRDEQGQLTGFVDQKALKFERVVRT
jgi:hypothetical protein